MLSLGLGGERILKFSELQLNDNLCFLTTRVELMTSTQNKMLRYVTIRLKWKTGVRVCEKQLIFIYFITSCLHVCTGSAHVRLTVSYS